MAIIIDIETNPLDVLKSGEQFVFKAGQTVVRGEFVALDGGEYIVPDQASVIEE